MLNKCVCTEFYGGRYSKYSTYFAFSFFFLSSLVLFRRKIKRQFVETESERKIERDKKNKNTVIHSRQLFIVENFGD